MKKFILAALAAITMVAISVPAEAAIISIRNDDTIKISGFITGHETENILEVIRDNPGARLIYITSEGGRPYASLGLARSIRKSGFPLVVVKQCDGGCAYSFLSARSAASDVPVTLKMPEGGDQEARQAYLRAAKDLLRDIGRLDVYDELFAHRGDADPFVVSR